MSITNDLTPIIDVVTRARTILQQDLEAVSASGGITMEIYHRYISFQYHLTKGVQRSILKCVAHPDLSGKKKLRKFLFTFALEEEPHYKVAESDLRNMGLTPMKMPLDVALWWTYFDRIVEEKPFVRLGTTCVLENLGAGTGPIVRALFERTDFLNRKNTRFLEIHLHEILPHGDQILDALRSVTLNARNLQHLVEGANTGSIMYLRLSKWAMGVDELTSLFDATSSMSRREEGVYEDLDILCQS